MNDTDTNAEQGNEPKTKKPFLSPTRILLWVLAAAGLVLIALEYPPKQAYNKTYQAIERELAADEEPEAGKTDGPQHPFSKNDVEQLIRGKPTREVTGDTETFTWKSLLKQHRFRLQYDRDGWVLGISPVGT